MNVVIEVTQKDIDAGVKKDCNKCPIALAMLRAFPEAAKVCVDGDCLTVFVNDREMLEATTTEEAYSFIERFDSGDLPEVKVEPFTFTAEFNKIDPNDF